MPENRSYLQAVYNQGLVIIVAITIAVYVLNSLRSLMADESEFWFLG